MSRRDTIIIAVLLNAGLLIVLFATSLKSDKTEETTPQVTVLASNQPEMAPAKAAKTPASASVPPSAASSFPAATDEVDQVLKQYITPQVTGAAEGQPNFLADLQAIGSGAAPTSVGETPSAAPSTDVSAEPSFKEVKVKKGDVLERIARQNHVTVHDIMKANKLASTRLKIGQTLKIPVKGQARAIAKVSEEGAQYYTVKNGDNPWTIAVKHHMKVDELLQLNEMDENKARRLKPGDRLRVK